MYCGKCGCQTYTLHLAEHMASCFKCEKCKKQFLNQRSLENHDCQTYSCSACAKVFHSCHNLKLHFRNCFARVKCHVCINVVFLVGSVMKILPVNMSWISTVNSVEHTADPVIKLSPSIMQAGTVIKNTSLALDVYNMQRK